MPPHHQAAYFSRQKGSVLELPQEEGDEEAAQHQAHGEQRGVGVGSVHRHHGDGGVAGGVVVQAVLRHHGVPWLLPGGVQVVVVQDQRVGLEGLGGLGYQVYVYWSWFQFWFDRRQHAERAQLTAIMLNVAVVMHLFRCINNIRINR